MPNIVDIYRQKKATEESKEYERKMKILRSENWKVHALLKHHNEDISKFTPRMQEQLQKLLDQIP